MKEYNKSSKLEHVAYDIRGPVLEEAMRMRANGEKILRLNTGNPAEFGFTAPDEVIHDLIMNARDSEGYSDSKGIFSARKAIMQYCQLKKFPNVDIDDIKSKITSNTKAIVLINPNNPTGALYPKELLLEIIEIARQNDLIIFADEIYDRMVMDGHVHTPVASLAPDVFCVSMNGLSKSHRIAGFRVGWMVLSGPKHHVKGYIEGLNMLSNMRLCSNVLAQQVVQTSLGGHQSVDELLLPGGRIYEQRNFIYNAIQDIPGLSAVKPKAGLYIFPKIDRNMYCIDDDEQFVLNFLKQEKVLLVHGRGFNWKEPDHFRIVYLPRVDELAQIQEKMTRFLKQYRR